MWVIFGLVCWTIVFPSYLFLALLVGVVMLGVSACTRNGIKSTPIDIPVILLLCLLPGNLYITPTSEQTSVQIFRLVLGILLCYAIVAYVNESHHLARLFDLNRFLVLGLSFYGFFTIDEVRQLTSTFLPQNFDSLFNLIQDKVNANVLAGILIVLLPLTLAEGVFTWSHQTASRRIFAIISIVAGFGMLGLSQSRGALIAFGCSIIILLAARWRKLGWGAVVLTVAALGFVMTSGIPRLLEYVANNPGLSGLPGRTEIWRNSIILIQDFPFTGVGMGSFPFVLDHLYPILYTLPQRVQHAHNIFLQIGADLGLGGLVVWLAIVIAIVVGNLRVAISRSGEQDLSVSAAAVGCLGSLGALLVHGLFDSVTWGMVRPAPLVWWIWGIGVSATMLSTTARTSKVAKAARSD